jgi:hypothetical protein
MQLIFFFTTPATPSSRRIQLIDQNPNALLQGELVPSFKTKALFESLQLVTLDLVRAIPRQYASPTVSFHALLICILENSLSITDRLAHRHQVSIEVRPEQRNTTYL